MQTAAAEPLGQAVIGMWIQLGSKIVGRVSPRRLLGEPKHSVVGQTLDGPLGHGPSGFQAGRGCNLGRSTR